MKWREQFLLWFSDRMAGKIKYANRYQNNWPSGKRYANVSYNLQVSKNKEIGINLLSVWTVICTEAMYFLAQIAWGWMALFSLSQFSACRLRCLKFFHSFLPAKKLPINETTALCAQGWVSYWENNVRAVWKHLVKCTIVDCQHRIWNRVIILVIM